MQNNLLPWHRTETRNEFQTRTATRKKNDSHISIFHCQGHGDRFAATTSSASVVAASVVAAQTTEGFDGKMLPLCLCPALYLQDTFSCLNNCAATMRVCMCVCVCLLYGYGNCLAFLASLPPQCLLLGAQSRRLVRHSKSVPLLPGLSPPLSALEVPFIRPLTTPAAWLPGCPAPLRQPHGTNEL